MTDREQLEPVYVWDVVVRATHWVIALSMLVLATTGFYLGHPFLHSTGPARDHFVTGLAKVIHFYAAIAFALAVVSRVAWMFVGPRRSGWRQFVPTSRRRVHDLLETAKFYLFLRREPPRTIGHNPLAGLTYVGVFALYILMIATGLAVYSQDSHSYMRVWSFLLPLFHGAQSARWLHHVTMWLLIAFFVAHLFFAWFTSRSEKNGVFDSIMSGYKFVPRGQPDDDTDASAQRESQSPSASSAA